MSERIRTGSHRVYQDTPFNNFHSVQLKYSAKVINKKYVCICTFIKNTTK